MQTQLEGRLTAGLRELAVPVFLASFDPTRELLTLHVYRDCDTIRLIARVKAALQKTDVSVKLVVRAHRLRQLALPRSLEHWLKRFDVGNVLHDPTLILSRARQVLEIARACRAELGAALLGNYFDPDRG